jgi:hypothetical protein
VRNLVAAREWERDKALRAKFEQEWNNAKIEI